VLLGKKLGAREKLMSAVKDSGEVHDFEQPTGKALVKWVVSNARKHGLELPEDVAQSLTERCSGDKTRLLRETEKLSLYVSERPAAIEDVEALAAPDLQSNIFAFVDSLAAGRQDRSLKLLEELLAAGEPPLRVMYMIRRQFLLIARAAALLDRGVPQSEVAKQVKVPPFVVRKLEEQSRKLGTGGAEHALEQVLLLEGGLKGASDLKESLQVELSTLKLSSRALS
jgi:DNA polymerase-3 subunit delta